MEAKFEDYSAANLAKVFDGADGTCEDLQNYWTYLPMTTIRTSHFTPENFTVTVKVRNEIQVLALKTTSVFVSQAGIADNEYYQPQEYFQICKGNNSLSFNCYCLIPCSVYIRFRFKSMQDVGNTVYTICEIVIT